jgi:FkbM family methyltransferase
MKIFLDCGYYKGKALEYYAPLMDESWTVYAFEPNIELDVAETIKRFPFEVQWIKKAVWIEDGTISYRIAGREDACHIDGLHPSVDKQVDVPCIDFSSFVANLPEGSTIVCSMDIEGAEFNVLKKMLVDGTASRLSLLDIEFHHRLIEEKSADDASALRIALEGEEVLVKLKLEF